MKLFGKQKKDESENISSNVSDNGLEGFEQELENNLKEEHTQVIAIKKEESKSKAMVRTLLDADYSIDDVTSDGQSCTGSYPIEKDHYGKDVIASLYRKSKEMHSFQ